MMAGLVVCASVALCLHGRPAAADAPSADGPLKRVLILQSFGSDFAPYNSLSASFRSELPHALGEPVEFHEVSVQATNTTNPAFENALVGYLTGKGFGRPLAETGVWPRLATQMILVGEESSRLEEMLGRVADVYDREVQVAIKRFLAILEPALILGLAVPDRRHRKFSILLGVMGMSELVG